MTQNTTLAFLKSLCSGKWSQILVYTEPDFKEVVTKRDRSTPCLVKGCQGALKVLADFDETGGMACDSCGVFPDGHEVLRSCCGFDDIALESETRRALDNIDFWPDLLR